MTAALGYRATQFQGYTNVGTLSNHTVDASNEGVAWVFQSETDAAITHVWFRYGLRVGTPPTYRISLQSINTSGNPDGTVLGGGSPASATFTPPADTSWDGLGQWIALDNSYTPTVGQVLVLTIEYSSGTIDASNYSSFTRTAGGSFVNVAIPYNLTNTGGTWSKQTAGPVFAYRTASSRYGVPVVANYITTTNTTGRRYAAKINLPSAFGASYKVAGMTLFGVCGSSGNTIRFGIWDAAGTELATTGTLDSDAQASLTNASNFNVIFTTQPTLNYGTAYYFGVESVGGSSVGIRGVSLTDDDDRLAFPLQKNTTLTLWDGAAWNDVSAVYPFVDLSFADITAAGGGGGLVVPIISSSGSVLIKG